MQRACQRRLVHNSDSRGRHEMKFRLGNREIFLPTAKSKLRLQLSGLTNNYAYQTIVRIRLQQDIANLVVGIVRAHTRRAAQKRVAGSRRMLFPGLTVGFIRAYDFHAAAQPVKV